MSELPESMVKWLDDMQDYVVGKMKEKEGENKGKGGNEDPPPPPPKNDPPKNDPPKDTGKGSGLPKSWFGDRA